jgi:hypothetical protein
MVLTFLRIKYGYCVCYNNLYSCYSNVIEYAPRWSRIVITCVNCKKCVEYEKEHLIQFNVKKIIKV